MPSVYVPPDMYDDGEKLVQPIRIRCAICRVEQSQLQRECDAISEFDVLSYILLVLEAFEVQSEYIWQLLDLHSTLDD